MNQGAMAAVISLFGMRSIDSPSVVVVDKVIIAQESLERFINAMSPGTYESLTKVDFKTLDQLMIKPLGVYGSKVELVRLLRSLNAVNEDMCVNFIRS